MDNLKKCDHLFAGQAIAASIHIVQWHHLIPEEKSYRNNTIVIFFGHYVIQWPKVDAQGPFNISIQGPKTTAIVLLLSLAPFCQNLFVNATPSIL